MLCFLTPHFQTRCGLAVLNLRKGYGPPFAKNRTSFTTSDASDAENLGAVATLPAAACVPPGTWGNHPQPAVPQNHPRPQFGPRRPLVAEQAMACSGRNPRVRSTRLFLSEKHRVSPPREAPCGGFHPRWGNAPPQPGQGPVWATQGPVWQKEKKTAQPGKQPPA